MRGRKFITGNVLLLLIFLSGLVPACSTGDSSVSDHDQEHALLLQISSHARMSGEPDLKSYTHEQPTANKLAFAPPFVQVGTATELDIMIDLYTSYMSRLQESGNLTDSNINRIEKQLQAKIQNLNKRSQQLQSRRRRRRRGLAGFFRRVGRAIGRFARTVGRGIGKAAEYLIEEVAPEVIRDMVLTGQPLTAKVFWKGVRKVVRSRVKNAIGRHLARRGVPPVLLAEAGLEGDLEAGGEGEGEQEPGDQDESTVEEQSQDTEIAYGNFTVDVKEADGNWGYFTWKEFWTDLPETYEYRCQTYSSATADVQAYLEEYNLSLDFELDSGILRSSTEGDGVFDLPVEVTNWVYAMQLEDGWVKPSADATGWSFGGTMIFDITIHDEWRCFQCIPVEGGCDIKTIWLEDEKATTVNAKLEGWTEQIVAGKDDEPDRLMPGGIYTMTVTYEDSEAELYLGCEDCRLPADFPPPVYIQE